MLVIIPLSASDEPRLPHFLRALKAFGPYYDHHVLLVPTPEVAHRSNFNEVMHKIGALFGASDIRETQNDPEGGWPKACNMHFAAALYHQQTLNLNTHWMWLEADCTPLKKGWIDELDYDYRACGKPYYGFIGKSHEIRKYDSGEIKAHLNDPHMEGVAIYPANHVSWCPLATAPSDIIPFDIYCQYYTTQRGDEVFCFNSSKMTHRWRTHNYRMVEGEVVCDDIDNRSPELSAAGKVDLSGKVLHHGDKSGSLLDLILGEEIPEEVLSPPPVVTAPVELRPPTDEAEPIIIQNITLNGQEMEELMYGVWINKGTDKKTLIDRLQFFITGYAREQISAQGNDPLPGDNAAEPFVSPTATGGQSGAEETPDDSSSPAQGGDADGPPLPKTPEDLILHVQNPDNKKLRLGDVMRKWGISKDQRAALRLKFNENGFNIRPPADWMNLK